MFPYDDEVTAAVSTYEKSYIEGVISNSKKVFKKSYDIFRSPLALQKGNTEGKADFLIFGFVLSVQIFLGILQRRRLQRNSFRNIHVSMDKHNHHAHIDRLEFNENRKKNR